VFTARYELSPYMKQTRFLFERLNISTYFVINVQLARTPIKHLAVLLDSKLLFHHHVDYAFSQPLKILGIIPTMTFYFSAFDSFLLLYVTLVRSKLEYASPVWNSIKTTDASKLQRVQRKFVALCFSRFFPQNSYNYASALEHLKLHIEDIILMVWSSFRLLYEINFVLPCLLTVV
jgi:hypothetical protein